MPHSRDLFSMISVQPRGETPPRGIKALRTIIFIFVVAIAPLLQASVVLENITPSFIRHPLDSAYIVSTSLKNSDEKAKLLKKIAVQYALSGDTKIAFQIGLDIQKNFPGTPEATMVFPEIGASFSKKGQRNDAITLVNALKENIAKSLTAEYIALTYIQQRQLDVAQAFINDVENSAKKTRLSLQLAESYASDGFFQKAETLLKEAPPSQSKNQSLANIAILAAKNQQLPRAEILTQDITDSELQAQALSEMVSIGGSNQQFQESLRIANSIVSAKNRSKALAYLAGGYAKHKRFADALNIADMLTGEAKDIANARISKSFGELGEFQSAEHLLGKIQSQEYKFDSILGIANGYVQEGSYEKAVQSIENIKDENFRTRGLITLGEFLGTAQQFHYVQLLIRQFRPDTVKNQAISRYVSTFVRHASHARVLRIAQEITDLSLRNETLSMVADYYLSTGQFTHAKQAIATISNTKNRHAAYINASQAAKKNQNIILAQEFLTTDSEFVSSIVDADLQALYLCEIATQFVTLQQMGKAKNTLEKAYDLVKKNRDWYLKEILVTTIANTFILTEDPVMAYQIIMKLPRLEDQTKFLLQAPNDVQTASEEKKTRAMLRELARSAQLRPK